ncbi:E3 SUMO-protein ligase SIZ1-like isoform X2 [Diospyros lotus]|uniref:E3 SUMO-protein ligase SIZ1-like isoform X2 n=1 Tax=Diospyros lotus TaxID=55363 RepID=UPI00225A9B7D|nr:E3 SUMO-protein ligase SIZ1-like isoform X2 [Diospyros lotus]
MDLVSTCKDKLAYFRIKELKDVLTQLGLSKQGKKQDLVDRILANLSSEQVSGVWAKKNAGKQEVAKLVDDIYRKMQVSGATDLASKGQCVKDISNVRPKEEIEDSYQMDKICCPCGSSSQTESMIKCVDPECHAWQHRGCVVISEKPEEGITPAVPEVFYCELCRLKRADPTNPVQGVEETFQLTRADKDLLLKQGYNVQAWCMLLNDKVPFRMHWPPYAELKINGVPQRPINRPGTQLLGLNGRDDGFLIKTWTRDGINKISLTGCDSRIFCFGVRIVKRRTIQQILNLIPKESDGEPFEDALARVRRCTGGGTAMENEDGDSDLEIVADSIPVHLRCPMSGMRMKVAGRFKPCLHMGCFDLGVFVEMNERSRKWQCPICLKNYSLENLIIDPYFNRITSKMQNCGEDVTEIEVKPDGSWRAKAENGNRDLGDLRLWHFADGTLCVPVDGELKSKSEASKDIKQGVSDGHAGLKLGIRKNQDGFWEVSRPEDMHALSPGDRLEKFENHALNVIPMSSSATGSGRDGEDPSVSQDGGGNFDFSAHTGIELDSISPNIDQVYDLTNQNTAVVGNAKIIVLSDSEEENDTVIAGTVYENNKTETNGVAFSFHPSGNPDSDAEFPAIGTGGGSYLGHFTPTDDDFGMPLWPSPPGSQAGPSFQLFGTDADVSDPLVDFQHGSVDCGTSMNRHGLTAETGMQMSLGHESSVDPPIADMNDGLIDNPLVFSGDDPSLQIFLPTRPSDASMLPNLRDQPDVSNSIRSEDWTCLRLGRGGIGTHGESAVANGLNSRRELPSKEGAMDTLANTASLLLGMNENRRGKTNRQKSDGPFSFPRQPRSVRPRLYLSIDSDSE